MREFLAPRPSARPASSLGPWALGVFLAAAAAGCQRAPAPTAAAVSLVAAGPVDAGAPDGGTKVKDERVHPLTEKWQKVLPQQAVPEGLLGLSFAECARCHPGNAAEWKTSAHAAAWVDPQFQAEMEKDALWACATCHAPLQNQQPFVIRGLRGGDLYDPVKVENPGFDPALREEGVTCAGCHVRDGTIIGPRESKAPHPVRAEPHSFGVHACEGCHDVTARFKETQVCSFDTVRDWRASPLPLAQVDCVTCHMPIVDRVTSEGQKKKGRAHFFHGAGIPKLPEWKPVRRTGLLVKTVLPEGEVQRGQSAAVKVELTNANAGHAVPTGNVDRFIVLLVQLTDPKGAVLWESRTKFGEEWKWWPASVRVADTSIARGETRTVALDVPIPAEVKGACLRVSLENHRITPKTARYMKLAESYPRSALAHREVHPLPLAGGAASASSRACRGESRGKGGE